MVGAVIAEEEVQPDAFGPLRREFAHDASVNVPRPLEAEMKVSAELAAAEDGDGIIADEHEAKLIADGWVEIVGDAQPPIVSNPFQALKELQSLEVAEEGLRETGHADAPGAERERDQLEVLQLHSFSTKQKAQSNPCHSGR